MEIKGVKNKLVLMAVDDSTTHVSEGKRTDHVCHTRLIAKLLLMVVVVEVHDWKEENGDKSVHLHQLTNNVEVGVDSIPEQKERVLGDLLVGLWNLKSQLLEESHSQISFEILFGWLHASLECRQDMLEFGDLVQWMVIFDIHHALVDLLSGKNTVISWLLSSNQWSILVSSL